MTPETTGTTDVPAPDAGPSGNYAASRLLLLTRGEQAGAPRRAELARLTDGWLAGLHAAAAPRADGASTALVAVGGYGRGELSPRSDLDLLLLHEGAPSAELATLADRLWYPVWDLGIALDHSVRDITTTRETARDDLKVRLGLLDARHVAGDPRLTERLRTAQLADWRSEAPTRLPALQELAAERARRYGELPHLLEPDLKEARGGLRDVTALRAVAASWVADAPRAGLAEAQEALLDVRDALHLTTGRSTDRLAQEDQPQVADALGLLDPDALLRHVYEASRVISYAWDVTWREVSRVLRPRGEGAARGSHRSADSRRRPRPARGGRGDAAHTDRRPLADGVVEHEGEAALARTARPERDPVLALRAAAAAARNGLPIALPALRRLAETAAPLPVPWPAEAREEFVTLLGTGPGCLPVWEAMTAAGLVTRLLPDWERVHCRPQRNPVHRWTVDRHLIETAVQAAALTRTVHRPDLLLVAALLHDIGKGWPGDHSMVGETIARDTARRIGFGADDTEVIATLVRHHLLLVETATRRDLDDPATVRGVAETVGTVDILDLLHALTTADALATGPAAWSRWRASLVADLVVRARSALAGAPTGAPPPAESPDGATCGAEYLARRALRADGPILVLGHPDPDPAPGAGPPQEGAAAAPSALPRAGENPEPVGVALTVALPERPGALPAVAGLLALHRLTVRSATLRTVALDSGGPVLVMRWRVAAVYGSLPDEDRLRADLVRVLEGSLDVAGRLAERDAAVRTRRRRYPLPPSPRVGIAARTDSSRATVLEVRAPDAPGLLHRIGNALEGREVRVRSAHVATLGADAVDSFYLTDSTGLPLTAKRGAAVVDAVAEALRE